MPLSAMPMALRVFFAMERTPHRARRRVGSFYARSPYDWLSYEHQPGSLAPSACATRRGCRDDRHVQPFLLRNFVAIADAAVMSRAAEHVGRTQAALSQQVKKLEEAIEQPLMIRTGRGVSLTIHGERLLAHAHKILRAHDEAVAELTGATLSGQLRFVCLLRADCHRFLRWALPFRPPTGVPPDCSVILKRTCGLSYRRFRYISTLPIDSQQSTDTSRRCRE